MSNNDESVSEIGELIGELTEVWEDLISHFNSIRDGLNRLKEVRGGKLGEVDHQLTINQVIKKIYEEM